MSKYDFPELNDCPFCGQKAIRVQHTGINWDGSDKDYVNKGALFGLWYVGCPSPFFEETCNLHCEIAPAAKWYAKLEDAENNWNNRGEDKE